MVVGVGVIWMGMWILRFCIWLVLELTNTNPESFGSPAKAIAYWIFEPGVFLVAVGVVALDVPQRIRLSLSSSALEKYVADVQAGTVAEQRYGEPPRRIGLYTVSETELLKDGVVRLITSSDGLDDVGLVFAKNSEPPVIGEDSYSHMTGPWWHWHRSW
ncbi:hypothetical protein [Planctomicrobium piriforme]|uniref:hypothetical protein n=1 Tax=Planctomicrobium piriforme TaxID=1576369 RepID=UPI0011140670|nr:hypothetical protein [Planctomicrobium piriforme]